MVVVVVGAFLGMVLPYLIKCREEPETTFDWSYFYTLVATTIFGAIVLIPAEITPSPQFWVGLFMSGFGVQSLLNKAKSEKPIIRVEPTAEEPPK